jgi:cardiolipin synthase
VIKPDRLLLSPEERRAAVLDVIRGARTRLILSLFRCNDVEVLDEFASARHRGVEIEALLTQRAKGGKRRLRRLAAHFEAIGASVWHYDDPLIKYHAKYIVADEGPALVGTFNLTRKCFRRTCDVGLVASDPSIVASLRALFAADCRRHDLPNPLDPRVLVGPNLLRPRLAALIASATRHIRIIDPRVDDPEILSLLGRRQTEGIRVDVATGRRVGDLKSHGKLIVIDGTTAVIGSMSLSTTSLDSRREVAIEVCDEAQVRSLADYYHQLAGTEPRPLVVEGAGDAV